MGALVVVVMVVLHRELPLRGGETSGPKIGIHKGREERNVEVCSKFYNGKQQIDSIMVERDFVL